MTAAMPPSSALEAVAREALGRVAGNEPLASYRYRISDRNPLVDRRFRELPSFTNAVEEISRYPDIEGLCAPGSTECHASLTLQLIYAFLGALASPAFDEERFRTLVRLFVEELSVPHWTHYAIANLKNFEGEQPLLDLGDGITARLRLIDELAGLLNWHEEHFKWLNQDWMEGGPGQYVILAAHLSPKTPDHLRFSDGAGPVQKIEDALLSLRLLKAGDVRVGRVCFTRAGILPLAGRAEHFSGSSIWHPGPMYRLNATETGVVRDLYAKLLRLREISNVAQRRLSVALRAFSSIYDRAVNRADDRIVDAFIAFEALLGTGVEITYRLAFRVAGLLARDDDERVALFEQIKAYYGLRSTIVHGGELDDADRRMIDDDEQIRTLLRTLLVGFLTLVTDGRYSTGRRFFDSDVDSVIQHAGRRSELRRAMSFER